MWSRALRSSRIVGLGILLAGTAAAAGPANAPPETKKDTTLETVQGVEIADPYRWLEDQSAPETRAWIDAQNAYTKRILGQAPGREALEKRIGELLRVDIVTTPTEVDYVVGDRVPATVQLSTFPDRIVREVPAASGYRYMVMNDRVLLVDPLTSTVVEEIN